MSDFIKFRDAVHAQFERMLNSGEVFYVKTEDRNTLTDAYLNAFPEGTNPIFRERTEHDCSCCKNFIRNIGHVVSLANGNDYETVWDVNVGGTYQVVADAMAKLVRSKAVEGIYRSKEKRYGEKVSHAQAETWEHFYATLPNRLVLSGGQSVGDFNGTKRSDYGVFMRSLEEISDSAVEIVTDLIEQNSIYRGSEHLSKVKELAEHKRAYAKLKTNRQKEMYVWSVVATKGSIVRFRNTVIGTLLSDISEGVDLERAVKSYEDKVAPHNYKRSKALVTQGMIDKAREKVEELGLEPALHRRFAKEDDLTINNVLFADRSANLKNSVFDEIKPTKRDAKPDLSKVEEVSAEDFVQKILPKAETVELFVDNKHENNLVSLIAPVYEDAPNLFKWRNGFSWSYNGEVTDSIKERVKSAGGNVEGDVRVSLSWSNYDDLDIHVVEPSGNEIFYGNKSSRYTGGRLDVDMNAGGRDTREPVENIFWKNVGKMADGTYKVFVHNYSKRETEDVGFTVQTEVNGEIQTFHYDKAVGNNKKVNVLTLRVEGCNVEIKPSNQVTNEAASKEVWGIKTQQFVKTKLVLNSPNHWDGEETGNKHLFFMLEDCVNPERARGFYNEFLHNELTEHRKVFEVLSSKMKVEPDTNQLSGLGFSTTKRDSVLCKVSGSFNRVIKINF